MRALLAIPALLLATGASAQLRAVPDRTASVATAQAGVDVFLLNEGPQSVTAPTPDRIEVRAEDGTPIVLVPDGATPASTPISVAAGGFALRRYVAASAVSASPPVVSPTPVVAAAIGTTPPIRQETVAATGIGRTSGFLDRFRPHEPIYGAIGAGDSATKLQVSLALAPFGGTGALSHFRFAYTQTMFWATDLESGPFRATTYSPEVFGEVAIAPRTILSGGFRHDSNGEGPLTSIDVNRIFVRAAQRFDLGGRWYAEVVPQAWFYVGRARARGGIADYWGNTSLKTSIGQDDGIKLSVTGRGSVDTGRGAAEMFVSYPLTKVGNLGIYLFGQGFTGYGEALDDYRVRDTHARIGISLTR